MAFAIKYALADPARSGYLWLLAKPTKHERMLLTAFHTGGSKTFSAKI